MKTILYTLVGLGAIILPFLLLWGFVRLVLDYPTVASYFACIVGGGYFLLLFLILCSELGRSILTSTRD